MDNEMTRHAPARDTQRLVRRLVPGGCECCAAGTMKNPTNPSTCDGCSHSFDEHCVPEVECPECGQNERVISRKIWEHYRRADATTEICPGSGLELTVDAVGNVMRKQLQRERLTGGPVPGGFVPFIENLSTPGDEANEGNYAAAAELQKALTSGTVEVPMSEVPGHNYTAPDHCAETDPMCPKPMAKGSMYCDEHRITARQNTLRKVIGRYFEMLRGKVDDTTAEGSAEQDLRSEQIDAAMRLIDLAGQHMLPYSLVNAAEQLEKVTQERDLAIAHDQQPYPTAHAYEQVCRVLRERETERDELQKRVDVLEANERNRKSLDRLKPQLARRIADVIAPETEGMKAGAVILNPERETELVAARERAEAAARRLVEAGLRFIPTDAEAELATKHLRFIVACTKDQSFLQEWDGELFERADQPGAQSDLMSLRRELQKNRRLSGAGSGDPENWGVFGLVRVPDEVVFGKQEADRG